MKYKITDIFPWELKEINSTMAKQKGTLFVEYIKINNIIAEKKLKTDMRFTLVILICGLFILSGFAQKPAVSSIFDDSVNVESRSDQYEVNVYPNPVETGRVSIEMNHYELLEIRLIDIGGKEIKQKKISPGTSRTVLTVNEIPNGIYFIRIKTTDNKVYVKKLVLSSN